MGPACACPAVWAWTPPSPRSTACPRAATWACPVGPVAGAAFPGSALAEAPAGALSAPPSQSMSLGALKAAQGGREACAPATLSQRARSRAGIGHTSVRL
eukprot:CAMPEP_0179854260 /NCGR_PEP_ID=MMETSP0982-20121206/9831_1 /TAXON_ID=483367 /ORGANISM="non described non described, Strain CCMP 2436" /LENGTH=99 /DNA_ID=CAMNT_0021740119 /DNA_START=444 /DNA_END=744 /DNA_ORIENTATION=+